ncbi:MAG: hypothetical protein WAP74_03870 [Patescibacteria group bacterium]
MKMGYECGDSDCDPNYDADAFFSFDKTSDHDSPSGCQLSDLRPKVEESLFQKIGTLCMAGLVGGIILLCLLLLLAIPVAVLVGLLILSWKMIQFTHYLILIPLLIVGTWLLMILKFVMSDPKPRISKF